jgi:hypothetical protein
MKEETVRQFMLKKYPTKDYLDCPVPKHYWPIIQEYAEEYARIQIEKDRERIKSGIVGNGILMRAIRSNVDDTPITLD